MNTLFDDATVDFLLDAWNLDALLGLEPFRGHNRETLGLALQTARRFARETLFPLLRKLDQEPPEFKDGRIHTHPELKRLYKTMADAGYITMLRPEDVGGMGLP